MLKLIDASAVTETNLVNPLLHKSGELNPSMFSVNSGIKYELYTTWSDEQRYSPQIEDNLGDYEHYLKQQDYETLKESRDELKEEYKAKLFEIEAKFQELNEDLEELFVLKGSLISQDNVTKVKEKEKRNEKLMQEYRDKGIMNTIQREEESSFPEKLEGKKIRVVIKNATYQLILVLSENRNSFNYDVSYVFRGNPDFLYEARIIRKIEKPFDDYEKALEYFNGRIDYYKKKYFSEEKPKLDINLFDHGWEYNGAVMPDNTRVALEGYLKEL
jgi:hypothetical protein